MTASSILVLCAASPALSQTTSTPQAVAASQAAFALAPLPYAYEALAPVIDAETMRIHHGRHHQAYVNALNGAVGSTPALQGNPKPF